MNYLFLAFEDGGQGNALSPAERIALAEARWANDQALRENGRLLTTAQLQGDDAITVRLQERQMSVADGARARSNERLAAMFLVNARDLNEAIQVAAAMPQARLGSIEIWATQS